MITQLSNWIHGEKIFVQVPKAQPNHIDPRPFRFRPRFHPANMVRTLRGLVVGPDQQCRCWTAYINL